MVARNLVAQQCGVDGAFVLGAVRTFDRERVLETEVVKDVLPTLLELVSQIGIIKNSQPGCVTVWLANSYPRCDSVRNSSRVMLFRLAGEASCSSPLEKAPRRTFA